MVQLKVLSGRSAGAIVVARRFPLWVGRASGCDLQLEEPGVWDQHFSIRLNPGAGFELDTEPNALVSANGHPVQHAVLRNGDVLEVGGAKLQFWLAEAGQRGLQLREVLFWTIVSLVTLAQVLLIYWLVR
jgi:hypothetical protein